MQEAPADLKHQAMRGMRWLGFGSAVGVVLQVLQQMVLVRLIPPSEFGIASLVTSVSLFAAGLLDFGITNAIVHKQTLNERQLQSLFWFNYLVAGVLFAATWALAEPVAHFYGRPQLAPFFHWISIVFLFLPLGQQYRALHQKQLGFSIIALNELWATAASVVVSIGLALLGYEAAALVASFLARHITQNVLFFWQGRRLFRPRLVFHWQEVRPLVRYGLLQVPLFFLSYPINDFDKFFIARKLGMQPAGLYDASRTFVQRPMWIITPLLTRVSFPVFAQLQNDQSRLARAYLTTTRTLALATVPIYAVAAIAADPLVRVFFGHNWLAAIPLVRWIALFCIIRTTMTSISALLVGIGRLRPLLYCYSLHLLLILGGVWFGSAWGAVGVAAAVTTAQLVMWLVYSALVLRPILGVRLWQVLEPGLTAALLAALAIVPGIWLVHLPLPDGLHTWMPGRLAIDIAAFLRLVLTATICLPLYGVLVWCFLPEGRRLLLDALPAGIRRRLRLGAAAH